MKYTITLLTAAVAVAAAQPHNHHAHQHLHEKREAMPNPVADVVVVPGPTEIAYVLNGEIISAAEVEEGLKNGTLVMASGGSLSVVAESSTASSSAWVAPTSTSAYVAPTTTSTSVASTGWASSSSQYSSASAWSSSSAASSASASASSSSSSSSSDDSDYDSDTATGVTTDFPDGEIDCSTFPSDYGAVAVDWIGIGGWTGIQSPGLTLAAGFADIETIISGGSCEDGMYCSYACPAGYQKSQWPSTQGSTGQSVGGLLCDGGKLKLTNSDYSTLCITGATEVLVLIENNLSDNVAVCRTDYPGTESETVPLDTQAGTTSNLTCPNAADYYTWEGSATSAQYYVNPAGVSVSDACQWGSDANPWGNYAPLNLGVGYTDGAAWLSIFQNLPTTSATLDFTVEITGDNLSGTCRYKDGEYCSGTNYETCSTTTGCTVSLTSGTATYVFSSS